MILAAEVPPDVTADYFARVQSAELSGDYGAL